MKKKKAKQRARRMLMDIWNPVGLKQNFIRSPCLKEGSSCADDPRGFNTLVKAGATSIGTNFPHSDAWARRHHFRTREVSIPVEHWRDALGDIFAARAN